MSRDLPKLKFSNKLQGAVSLVCALVLLVPPIDARTKQGDKLLKLGQKAESNKDYDTALRYYDQALATDSEDAGYLLADQRMRTKVGQLHIAEARTLQQQQHLEEALAQYQKAFVADPGSEIAVQGLKETTAMIKQRARVAAGTPILTPAERARQEVEQRINSLQGPPSLRPITNQINSIKMNNQPARVLYETVAKLAGINVLMDPQGIETQPNKNYNLDLNNATLEEALDYIALETHTFWKPISRNAIFVSQETQQKRAEYQDEVVKVFYIQNASTANEFTEIFNGVRTVTKLATGVFSIPSQNAIVARGSTDTMALVEKLVHELDRPKAEVVIDVMVMEVNKTVASTLGASLFGQGGLSQPLTFTPRNPVTSTSTTTGTGTGTSTTGTTGTGTTGTTGAFTLAQAGHFSSADYATSLPSTLVQALMNDSRSHILQRPQVRATDGGKASLKIGQKIPYASGSLNSAVATAGSIPYATTQFQQLDVGTIIELQPHVNGADEISMHVKVEVSTLLQYITIAGVQEPELGDQVDEADIRLKDGEMNILGGLNDKENSLSNSGFPGLTNIPVLGYLFGTKARSSTDNQILIAMVPHIVRAPDLNGMGQEGILAGTEQVTHVDRRNPDSQSSIGGSAIGTGVPPANSVQPQNPFGQPFRPAPQNPNFGVPPANIQQSPNPILPGAFNPQPNNNPGQNPDTFNPPQ